jgi:hypothetical protein
MSTGQGLGGGQQYQVSGTVEAAPTPEETAPEPTQPEPTQPEETKPEEEPVAENEEKQEGSGGSAIDKEVEFAKKAAEEHEEEQVAINEAAARATAAHRESYEGSDQQAVHEQIKEAEAAMRGPNIEIGVPGDPTKGPSS